MKISIFGLGYVGTVVCGCLAKEGHSVVGVDISEVKVDLINTGRSPIVEAEIGDIIKQAAAEGRLRATQDAGEAILNSEISLICVGTPSKANGSLDLTHIKKVCEQIGRALKKKKGHHVITVRSTLLPGTTKKIVIPLLERCSGKKLGVDFELCYNPEFMREGTSVYDFYNPPKTVIGTVNGKSGDMLTKVLYKNLPGETMVTSIEVSEMIKYVDNNFHAVKIVFANEIGMLCKQFGIDSHEVMDVFCKDTKLNISPAYLKPGFAFGGSCLPKDIRALLHEAKSKDLKTPLLSSLLESNQGQIKRVISNIIQRGKKKIGILGFSFKAGTDDLRESPLIEVIETLLGKGCKIKLYDRNVNIAQLVGANKRYIDEHIPHIARLMCKNLDDVLHDSEIIVIGNKADEFKNILDRIRNDQLVIDLARIDKNKGSGGNYDGIAW